MKIRSSRYLILWMSAVSAVLAQPPGPEPQQGPPPQHQGPPPQRPFQQGQPGQPGQGQQPGPGMQMQGQQPRPNQRGMFPGAPPGKWWHNPPMVQRLGLTPEQQKKMDDVFQQSRLRLIDLNASLQREEAMLDPLINSDQLDDARVLPQIDKVAQARAELEKANARLQLGIRHVLTPEQWKKLSMGGPGQPGPVGPPNGPGRE
jgi:Spy/CpxP family protein refolding chaperone